MSAGPPRGTTSLVLARITGVVELVENGSALLSVEGTGLAYEVMLSSRLAAELAGRIGEQRTLHTLQHIDASSHGSTQTPRLIGFASREERRFFELFTTVKGVGSRKALRAMAEPTGRIAMAIADGDTAFLESLPEIGKRSAQTIVAELRGKVDAYIDPTARSADEGAARSVEVRITHDAAAQALEALVRLGESRQDAERMIRSAVERDPDLASADEILAAAFGARGG